MWRDTRTIGIIGGTGLMGRWFNDFFTGAGYRVLISGRTTPLTYQQLASECHVVVLSLPLEACLEMAEKVGPLLHEDQLLMDLCSLKLAVTEKMVACTKAQVIGTHPLFGPNTDSLEGQNVVLCPGRAAEWLTWLGDLLHDHKANVTVTDAKTHDKNMAIVQGLTHFITISLARTLQKMEVDPMDLTGFATPIFRLKLDLVGRLFAQDLSLYRNLIAENPDVPCIVETFLHSAKELEETLCTGRKNGALNLLEEMKDYLGGFCDRGFKSSDAYLSGLQAGA